MVEHVTFNHGVLGSIPSALTNKIRYLVRNRQQGVKACVGNLVGRSIVGGMALGAPLNRCCIKASTRIEMRFAGDESLTLQGRGRCICVGACDRRCTMREEFASYSFLAVTIAGIVMLCSGLLALAIT